VARTLDGRGLGRTAAEKRGAVDRLLGVAEGSAETTVGLRWAGRWGDKLPNKLLYPALMTSERALQVCDLLKYCFR
jgi:hypothetical protein